MLKKYIENIIREYLREERKADFIKTCEKCRLLLRETDAQKIDIEEPSYSTRRYEIVGNLFYCPSHKKPYDVINRQYMGDTRYYKKDIEVDGEGNPKSRL